MNRRGPAIRSAGPLLTALAFAFALATMAASEPGPEFLPAKLRELDAAIEAAIRRGDVPGAVLHLESRGETYTKAYGFRSLVPTRESMTTDTIFDLASLTKVLATTPLLMQLAEQGRVDLDRPVRDHLPDFAGHGKETITVRQLLTHTSGLPPGIPAAEFIPTDHASGIAWILACRPRAAPGTEVIYSDLNFHVLAELIRRVTGEELDVLARSALWEPLGMTETDWRPDPSLVPRIAPTEREGSTVLRGIVHDPTSRRMGQVTGHAGLFGTADNLARFARMMLRGGAPVLHPDSIAALTAPQTPPGFDRHRGLGWDLRPVFGNENPPPPGTHLAYGHTGWTGTSLWIDPPRDLFVVLLTNRNHPAGGNVRELRQQVMTLAAAAARPFWQVENGIDVLRSEAFAPLQGLRVGLITNHTGRSRDGRTTIDLLHEAPGVHLTALFSPEHGIRGELDQSRIDDGRDERTGLPVHSLYGATRQPLPEHLEGLDALVFDIQDVGCRFYTYVSTMGLAMEAAAARDLRFFVLDRVNPLGGVVMDGPVQVSRKSFTSHHDVPLQHGLTVGELARLFVADHGWNLDLTVIPLRNWKRSLTLDETGLDWINPSPNLRNLTQATLYPGIGILEFLKLSVGRGTETPFEHVGAPYLDGPALAAALDAENLPGIRFRPTSFTPASSVFAGERCQGVAFTVTDRHAVRSLDTGLVIARHLAARHAVEAGFEEKMDTLLVHPATVEAIRNGRTLDEIRHLWEPELQAFATRRREVLLYP